jgi:hypothetical protein
MRPAAGKTFTSRAITLAGVAGAALLLVASGHFPAEATFLRFAAFVWFLAMGVVRLVVDLTDPSTLDAEIPPRHGRTRAGRR